MTALVDALRAVERGDPFAMRIAVDAMGIALDAFAAMSDAREPASDDGELPDQTRTAGTAEE